MLVSAAMVTTADLSIETGISQRVIQKRVARLTSKVTRAGLVYVLNAKQVAEIKAMSDKPGPKGK